MKVFLGGTCNGSRWRDELIPLLKMSFFNPIVPDWTEECKKEELRQREECDICLYVITPKMAGLYSIAEVVDDSNKRPNKTVFCFLQHDGDEDFNFTQIKSLFAVGELVRRNGGKFLPRITSIDKLSWLADELNALEACENCKDEFLDSNCSPCTCDTDGSKEGERCGADNMQLVILPPKEQKVIPQNLADVMEEARFSAKFCSYLESELKAIVHDTVITHKSITEYTLANIKATLLLRMTQLVERLDISDFNRG